MAQHQNCRNTSCRTSKRLLLSTLTDGQKEIWMQGTSRHIRRRDQGYTITATTKGLLRIALCHKINFQIWEYSGPHARSIYHVKLLRDVGCWVSFATWALYRGAPNSRQLFSPSSHARQSRVYHGLPSNGRHNCPGLSPGVSMTGTDEILQKPLVSS